MVASPPALTLWADRIQRQRASKLTIERFCQAEGFSVSTFHKWKRKVNDPSGLEERTVSEFLPIQLIASTPAETVTVELPGNVIVKIPGSLAPNRVAELIAACMREAMSAAPSREAKQ